MIRGAGFGGHQVRETGEHWVRCPHYVADTHPACPGAEDVDGGLRDQGGRQGHPQMAGERAVPPGRLAARNDDRLPRGGWPLQGLAAPGLTNIPGRFGGCRDDDVVPREGGRAAGRVCPELIGLQRPGLLPSRRGSQPRRAPEFRSHLGNGGTRGAGWASGGPCHWAASPRSKQYAPALFPSVLPLRGVGRVPGHRPGCRSKRPSGGGAGSSRRSARR